MFGIASWGPLPLRLAAGIVFIVHGYPKLFGGTERFIAGLTQIGFPFPEVLAYWVGIVEFGGGILLLLGLFTRVVALLLAGDMLVAIITAHPPWINPFSGEGGYEFPLVLMLIAVSLVLSGAGKLSLDSLLFRPKSRPKPHVVRRQEVELFNR